MEPVDSTRRPPSGDDLPELPSLKIPNIDLDLEDISISTRSPLRSNFKQQQAQRLQLLRDGSQRVRESLQPASWASTYSSGGVSSGGSAIDTAQTTAPATTTPFQRYQQHQQQQKHQQQKHQQHFGHTHPNATARTYDMASRLVSNFYRRKLPESTINATQWDDFMWIELAELVNSSFNGREINPDQLPGNVYSAFPFLGQSELEDRVRALIQWTILQEQPELREMQQVSRPYEFSGDMNGGVQEVYQVQVHEKPRAHAAPYPSSPASQWEYATRGATTYAPKFSAYTTTKDPQTPPQARYSWE